MQRALSTCDHRRRRILARRRGRRIARRRGHHRRLHILSPLPLHTAPAVRVLVSWHGAADVAVSLLYRGAPEGDPFCYPPELVTAPLRAMGAVGGDGGTSRRGTLKRGRRGDGKG